MFGPSHVRLPVFLQMGPMFSSPRGNTDRLFFQWVRALDKLPDEWWGRWEGCSEEFEEDGSF
jgi:hypothetical protein